MSDADKFIAASGKELQDRNIVNDKATEVLVNEVIRTIMKDHPDMSAGDAAVGLLNASIFVASRLPGVGWSEISCFLKTITDVIDSRTGAEMDTHYRCSQPLN